ncbi:uncharacterized protein LOC119095461 isoform X2 [Pollicipes pollicipes]|uniref:uncharacterized protein LOC119095461 isoform X2 n=1 Tax=Pollicipes pollicipes TaxID=41117 RepID=UPI0018859645|nr:uncharacterized protein LOC119095461 isoform X2 [Pollicipes pollicipes]
MKETKMLSGLLLSCLLASTGLCVPLSEKGKGVQKRDVIGIDGEENAPLDSYGGQILPGMVDDQVAEAFLKDAAAADDREQRGQEEPADDDDASMEVPLALPMARLADEEDDVGFGRQKPTPHRSKALADDLYPAVDGDSYIPYYPTGDVYFRRRRRARPAPHGFRKRSASIPARNGMRPSRLSATPQRRKRQIRLNDNDLGALIAFLTDLKVTMENELNEELGAGSGIDEDYTDDEEPRPAPEQEFPVWLMPHSYQLEPAIPAPQRRAFYYPTLLPGQKRAFGPRLPAAKLREGRLYGFGPASQDGGPPRKFSQNPSLFPGPSVRLRTGISRWRTAEKVFPVRRAMSCTTMTSGSCSQLTGPGWCSHKLWPRTLGTSDVIVLQRLVLGVSWSRPVPVAYP